MGLLQDKRVFIIDGLAITFRSHFAFKRLTTHNGFPTGAIYGTLQFIKNLFRYEKPENIVVIFDSATSTIKRRRIFKDYKCNRPPCPNEIKLQLNLIKLLYKIFGISVIDAYECEADDMIGTISKKFSRLGWKPHIYTNDKDMFQLLDQNTCIIRVNKQYQKYYLKNFEQEFKLKPHQVIDVLALAGDAADNIPGVKGIGNKIAVKLIHKYETIKGIYENIDQIKPAHIQKKLKNQKELLITCYRLATIDTNVPITVDIEHIEKKELNIKKLKLLLMKLEFNRDLYELSI